MATTGGRVMETWPGPCTPYTLHDTFELASPHFPIHNLQGEVFMFTQWTDLRVDFGKAVEESHDVITLLKRTSLKGTALQHRCQNLAKTQRRCGMERQCSTA